MPITDGQIRTTQAIGKSRVLTDAQVKRTYEKLRKRSYRSIDVDIVPFAQWESDGDRRHAAYVRGVKDALNEVTS